MKPLRFAPLLVLAGCAHAPPPAPVRVRTTDLATLDSAALRAGAPLIIEVHEGEAVPLEVSVDGALVASPSGAPAIPLVAKRTFWIKLDKEGLALSHDGRTFRRKSDTPGSFQFGVGATREKGLHAVIKIRTPKP
jgi:hypothetical protein